MRYFLLSAFLISFAPASAQQKLPSDAISSYFSEYVDDAQFTAIYVSGKVFQLVNDANLDLDEFDDEELAAALDMVRDISGIRVLHTEIEAEYRFREAKKRIPTDSYELLFKVRSADGSNIEAFIQNNGAIVNELFLLIGSPDGFAMLSLMGDVDLTKLSALQNAID